MAGGRGDVLEWDESQRRDIHQALKLIEGTDTGIDRAAFIFSEAAKLVGVDEILTACGAWKNNRPDKPTSPKLTSEAANAFTEAQKAKVSQRRHRTVKSYMAAYTESFGTRNLHEITTSDIEAWLEEKTWSAKTCNEVLGAIGLLYTFARTAKRDWVPKDFNPAGKVKRAVLKPGNIEIFEPWEARQILTRIETDYAELIPFLVLWFFSGCRKEEAVRVTWQQIHAAIKTGKLELRAGETKNGPSRVTPLLPNAKAWLQWWLAKYGEKQFGTVLPARWGTMTALDDMGKLLSRNCGITWRRNGFRHSYSTYRCLITDSTINVADESGNSPSKIEKHYRRKAVAQETAKEWFEIMPPKAAENIVPIEAAA
jgi:integrase